MTRPSDKPLRNLYIEEIMHNTKIIVKEWLSMVTVAKVGPAWSWEFDHIDCPPSQASKNTIIWLSVQTRFSDPSGFLSLILLPFHWFLELFDIPSINSFFAEFKQNLSLLFSTKNSEWYRHIEGIISVRDFYSLGHFYSQCCFNNYIAL